MSTVSEGDKPEVLFINYKETQCGVYQYGRNVFDAISKSHKYRFHYIDVASLAEIDHGVATLHCDAIIYNYHPQTLTFLDPSMERRYGQVNIALMHEMTQSEADRMPARFFQYFVMGDPTLVENNPAVFKTGRLITPYTGSTRAPRTLTIGTLGFAVGSKGYQTLIDAVQDEFDDALIRIHIPSNGIIDVDGSVGRHHIEACRQRIRKPGIRIEPTHQFLDREALLEFLAGNTINAFLYDRLKIGGISSSPDHALAVRRPMAITRSIMFRHLHSLYPPITLEDSSLREIIKNGTEPFADLYELWSEQNLRVEYESILDRALDSTRAVEYRARKSTNQTRVHKIWHFDYKKLQRRYDEGGGLVERVVRRLLPARVSKTPAVTERELVRASGVKRFNRILDNQARRQYGPVVKQLQALAPEIMVSKIPAANVQQAFILESVARFAAPLVSPRILCVGSYGDSACASLQRLGYAVDEIDPEVNGLDLTTFCQLPSTGRECYDIIFSTSVIEHVQDDQLFVAQIGDLLAPGGVGLLTCDYNDLHKPGDRVIQGNFRFYTQKDLILRILPAIKDCSLVDVPHWECSNPDFMYLGYRYTFASVAFRKRD